MNAFEMNSISQEIVDLQQQVAAKKTSEAMMVLRACRRYNEPSDITKQEAKELIQIAAFARLAAKQAIAMAASARRIACFQAMNHEPIDYLAALPRPLKPPCSK
jgi:hypothetical protein